MPALPLIETQPLKKLFDLVLTSQFLVEKEELVKSASSEKEKEINLKIN